MMPGETHSAAPGTAAGLSRCQGCASLQQNLNEYVEALITLKQKIINTDNLLTEYQKKCDELQFARRENSTLHHQVEQMLQKISPLQKCQEELGSLKAELEEKKSSLKLYQDTHQEYARVKEECLKTDAQKKKLEAKVKKLEEAAIKQIQDFKQLRNEKKILEKEFKKTQERLDEFSKQKNEKELRHIGTQISSDSYGSIDKRKVKLLLKELWLCINTAHRVPGEGPRCIPGKPAEEKPQSGGSGEAGGPAPAAGSAPGAAAVRTCLAELSMEIQGDFSGCCSAGGEGPACSGERQGAEAAAPRSEDGGAGLLDQGQAFDEDLQAAVDFFRLPPPLLSPVPSPPPGALPALGVLPSALAPETYFGEYTDSSDNDSAQRRNSAASVSEEDTSEAQDCFGSSRKTGSATVAEKLKSHEAAQALSTLEVDKVTAVGLGTFTATLRDPSATFSLAREKHWAVSSRFTSDGQISILDEAKRQREVREMHRAAHTEAALPHAAGSEGAGQLSGGLARETDVALRKSDLSYSALGRRPLRELLASDGKTPLSQVMGLPKPDFSRWTDEITSESDPMAVSDRLQELSRELEKEREATQRFVLGESPEPEEDAGDAMDATGLDAEAKFSSSTSRASSVCGGPQTSSASKCRDAHVPTEVYRSGQKLRARTPGVSSLRSEPPGRCPGEIDPGSNSPASSPELGASGVRAQSGGEAQCVEAVKGGTEVHTLPHSVFAKALTGGQCASQGLGAARPPGHSPFPPPAASPCGWIKGGFGFGETTSWRHSDVLGRGGEERPQAGSEREGTPPQLQRAAPSSENRGPASQPEPAGERSSSVGLRATASLLPNQVSVITTRARPGRTPCARPEPPRPHSGEPASAAEGVGGGTGLPPSVARRGAEREGVAQKVKEAAAVKRTSPEVSTSWRKSDFDSPSDPLPVDNAPCPANDKLSFFSENVPAQNQDSITEPAVQEEAQEQGPSPGATNLDSSGTGVDRLSPAADVASGGCPIEEAEVPRGDAVRCGGEAQAVAQDAPGVRRSREEPLELPASPPGGTSPGGPGTADAAVSSARGRKDDETRTLPETSLPSPVYCYTGVREVAGSDTEAESKAPSCSEGENEPEGAVGAQQQGATEASCGDGGDGAAAGGGAEPPPPVEVGCLASALLGCSISPLPEVDRLSTADMVKFLESCELRDYSSGDSVSECSSKETLNKETNEEVKQSDTSGEQYGKQLCEQETLGTCEEWVGSEDEDGPLGGAGQLAQCSLEALSEVLGRLGQEFQSSCEDPDGKDAASLLLFSIQDGAAGERAEEQVSAPEAAGSSPHPPGPPAPGPGAQGGSPAGGTSSHENTEDRPEGSPVAPRPIAGGDAAPSPSQRSDAGAEQAAEPGARREAGGTLQCQISTVTSEVINVLINKDQNLVIEKGDNWAIINGVALVPNVDQVILCDAPADSPGSPGGGGLAAGFSAVTPGEKSPESSHAGSPFQEPPCGSTPPCPQEEISSSGQTSNFDKSRLRNRPVKPSVRINAEIYDQAFESQTVASDHTYYNSKLEPLGKNKPRAKISNKEQASKPAKAASSRAEASPGEGSPSSSGDRGGAKPARQQTQTVLANADTSTPTDGAADALSKIRQEVGPPLPPLLAPLIATPPRSSHPVSPLISSSSPSSPTSPAGQLSPLCDAAAPPVTSPAPGEPGRASPLCASPSPSAAPAGERTLSSPLQFCAATPKHALPVPGRLPPCASAHAAVAGPQENSVKILDTMYPELSARARTLSILKGNIQLTRGPSADRQNAPGPVSAITGFKAITSTSTAFVKTGGSSGGDSNQGSGGKRTLPSCTLRSAKRLRLDSGSPDPETGSTSPEGVSKHPCRDLPQGEASATEEGADSVATTSADSQLPLSPRETVETHDRAIADALRKIAASSFDLLPVIRSHVYVGNISKKPVMRDEEKEVVYDFSTAKKHLAECLLHSILSELKLQKGSVEHSYLHALCRVYVGICRQLGDVERARLFCYSLLKEDFPESEKLTLFIANMWHDVFISQSVINKAMQLVARQRAKGEVLNCLRAFLSWEKNAPADVGFMVSKLLLTIQLCPKTEFQSSERFGEDLSDNTWEYIFAIDLLCCHQKWVWTHDNIISKELWPVMDKWIKYRKGHANIAYIPDIIIASILRLIGRLGQLGLKEGFPSAVRNISSVIGMFIQHAREEDIPWGIQLAAVYALCDLSPSNPAEISKILEAWRRETGHSVPSAVVSSLEEVSALCAEELG